MSLLITHGRELLRISPQNQNCIESSTNDGRSWSQRCRESFNFFDLTDVGKEILATTSRGLYASSNDGRSWSKRSD